MVQPFPRRGLRLRIAVITPAYNAAAFIGDTIRSVLGQTHDDWRMVVVDDGSGDGTGAAAAGFADPRIRLIRQRNAGVSAARNRGMADADADALLFLDADDRLEPNALAALQQTLSVHPHAVAASAAARFINPLGRATRHALPAPHGDVLARLLVRNRFANGGHLLIRRDAARRAGAFRTDLTYGEDWEYWVRIAALGVFAAVAEKVPLLQVRERAEGAYLRQAADPAAIGPCLDAIFGNPSLAERFTQVRWQALRRRAEAENAWVVGRALHRAGDTSAAHAWLLRSVAAAPSLRRTALLGGLWARDLAVG